jgi:hypothetical protein
LRRPSIEARRPIEDLVVGEEILVPPKGTWRVVEMISAPDHNDIVWVTFAKGHRHGFGSGMVVSVRRGSVQAPPTPPAAARASSASQRQAANPATPVAPAASLAEIAKRLLKPESDPLRRWATSRHAALAKNDEERKRIVDEGGPRYVSAFAANAEERERVVAESNREWASSVALAVANAPASDVTTRLARLMSEGLWTRALTSTRAARGEQQPVRLLTRQRRSRRASSSA